MELMVFLLPPHPLYRPLLHLGFQWLREGEVIDETAGLLFFPVPSPLYFHQCWDTLYWTRKS